MFFPAKLSQWNALVVMDTMSNYLLCVSEPIDDWHDRHSDDRQHLEDFSGRCYKAQRKRLYVAVVAHKASTRESLLEQSVFAKFRTYYYELRFAD